MFPRFFIIFFMILLIFRPSLGASGAAYGLSIWYRVILPSLLPFMILSNLMQRYQKSLAHRPWQIAVLGLLCGFPMGAKLIGDMNRQESAAMPMHAWLLSFCNQASPMFLFSYLPQMLSLKEDETLLLCFSVYFSAMVVSLIAFFVYHPGTFSVISQSGKSQELKPFLLVLEEIMMNALEIIVKIGLYMMLFSVLAYYLMELPGISLTIKCFLLAVNEMTTGIAFISDSSLPLRLQKSFAFACASFGGLSGFAQTCCVLRDSSLSSKHYLGWKFLQGTINFIFVYYVSS